MTEHTEYETIRAAYWEAQREFRAAGEAEMLRVLPDEIRTIRLQINDTPRLTVTELLDEAGVDRTEDFGDAWEIVDQIANDMEAFTWEEADSFLMGDGEGGFTIGRDDQ